MRVRGPWAPKGPPFFFLTAPRPACHDAGVEQSKTPGPAPLDAARKRLAKLDSRAQKLRRKIQKYDALAQAGKDAGPFLDRLRRDAENLDRDFWKEAALGIETRIIVDGKDRSPEARALLRDALVAGDACFKLAGEVAARTGDGEDFRRLAESAAFYRDVRRQALGHHKFPESERGPLETTRANDLASPEISRKAAVAILDACEFAGNGVQIADAPPPGPRAEILGGRALLGLGGT